MPIKTYLVRSSAAFVSIKHFEKAFDFKDISVYALKFEFWEALLTVSFLRLCGPIRDYSSCVAIFVPDFSQISKKCHHLLNG